jgi:3-phenylpropionate/trans-cinnamate dioxygenase ferredoxin subunit
VSYIRSVSETLDVCSLDDLPPGAIRRLEHEDEEIMVVNCGGEILAMEDRCSHDDGDLADGELDESRCTIECPRHGSLFDLRSGRPLTLPAYEPVETYPVEVEGGRVRVVVE